MTGNRFETCLAHVLKHEGFYSDDPFDPGGKTMRGITQRVYDAWRERQGLARVPVKDIAKAEIEAIYRANYWAVIRADELPAGLDLAAFDFAVNSGPSRAARHLQAVLGVNVDGHIGDVTLDAARKADAATAINGLSDSRLRFLRGLNTFWRFGKGWSSRVADTRAAALAAAGAGAAPDATAQPVPSVGKATSTPPKSMAGSKTGNVAVAVSAFSIIGLAVTLLRLFDAEMSDGQFSAVGFAASVLSAPDIASVLPALLSGAFGGIFVWLDRRAKLIRERV